MSRRLTSAVLVASYHHEMALQELDAFDDAMDAEFDREWAAESDSDLDWAFVIHGADEQHEQNARLQAEMDELLDGGDYQWVEDNEFEFPLGGEHEFDLGGEGGGA